MRTLLLALLLCLGASAAGAHKPSDAYLRLSAQPDRLEGSLDIALRDLETAIGLDGNGDGSITWGELRARHEAIAAYISSRLTLQRGQEVCRPAEFTHLVDRHTDGLYAVARFTAACAGSGALHLRYGLLFDLDPTHRGLVTLSAASGTTTAVLSPESPELTADLDGQGSNGFAPFYASGIAHIAYGWDHLLFLLVVLLPAAFRRENGHWRPRESSREVALNLARILTAFTLAHGLSLTTAVLGFVALSSRLVESAIAATIVLAAIDNLVPILPGRRWQMAFLFGLIHGSGLAAALQPMELLPAGLALALLGFNLGIESAQLAVALLFLALVYPMRNLALYGRGFLPGGSLAAAALGGMWLIDRALATGMMPF
jgi:hypothetical protein